MYNYTAFRTKTRFKTLRAVGKEDFVHFVFMHTGTTQATRGYKTEKKIKKQKKFTYNTKDCRNVPAYYVLYKSNNLHRKYQRDQRFWDD